MRTRDEVATWLCDNIKIRVIREVSLEPEFDLDGNILKMTLSESLPRKPPTISRKFI